jgi:hypothetical protein
LSSGKKIKGGLYEKYVGQNLVEGLFHYSGCVVSSEVFIEISIGVYMRFSFGKLVWTRGINDRVATDSLFARFVMESLKRHINCDWGELSIEDKRENDFSLDKDLRLFSSYQRDDWKIWIVTESDRSTTTILFPEEY